MDSTDTMYRIKASSKTLIGCRSLWNTLPLSGEPSRMSYPSNPQVSLHPHTLLSSNSFRMLFWRSTCTVKERNKSTSTLSWIGLSKRFFPSWSQRFSFKLNWYLSYSRQLNLSLTNNFLMTPAGVLTRSYHRLPISLFFSRTQSSAQPVKKTASSLKFNWRRRQSGRLSMGAFAVLQTKKTRQDYVFFALKSIISIWIDISLTLLNHRLLTLAYQLVWLQPTTRSQIKAVNKMKHRRE